MKPDLQEKIKTRGYWRINFQPLVYQQKISSLGSCRDFVERHIVRLRGWDYPAFLRKNDEYSGLEPAADFYLGWVDWENHKEFWHMYQSGQFLHYLALREDWLEEGGWHRQLAEQIRTMSSLGIRGVVYQMTEVFEFLCRLAGAEIYEEGVRVSISLNNTQNRQLWIEDRMRAPFSRVYKTAASKIEFVKQRVSKSEAIGESKEMALQAITHFFDRFGWHNPTIETLKKDQNQLLSGKI